MKVKNYTELQNALNSNDELIEICNSFTIPNSITLKKGKKLVGKNDNVLISFMNGGGIGLEGNNEVKNLAIQTSHNERAIFVNSNFKDLEDINLVDLTVTGVVQILTRGNNKFLNLNIENLDIIAADARELTERPMKYGVIVSQGALTVYNYTPYEDSEITANIKGLKIGRELAPVFGSGVFISGFNDNGGKVKVKELETKDIYSNGLIPTGQPNLITGAIFIVYGAHAKKIISNGVVKTYGNNDMVLDVWGRVDDWTTNEKVISYGSSGIGFVNFGRVEKFVAKSPIETYGVGARGFNQYDGTINDATFYSIKTVGDGSIGMQFSKPVGKITITKSIETFGGEGETLVKGVIKTLKADGISVLQGAVIEKLVVGENIETNGDEVVSLNIDGGEVKELKITGNIIANGKGSKERNL
ncbi:hypothetical protein [Peptostreptococcus porci]|uniref:hypothetical protein n=1 Tax=Peptostreptococcus porci TaxID=2652282 RepID=UPI002A81B395|nr:hypothetical protein [Peptostreptococcus porci]MDY4129007.1 hypothetical protein [Peptostreptococcus porci]